MRWIGTLGVWSALAFLVAATPAKADGDSQARVDESSESQDTARESAPAESKKLKHASCRELCLADGEDPLDCDGYCIHIAEEDALATFTVACR